MGETKGEGVGKMEERRGKVEEEQDKEKKEKGG